MNIEFVKWLTKQTYFYDISQGLMISSEFRSLIGGHWTWDEALIYYSIHR
jgi:hypothetical protein